MHTTTKQQHLYQVPEFSKHRIPKHVKLTQPYNVLSLEFTFGFRQAIALYISFTCFTILSQHFEDALVHS